MLTGGVRGHDDDGVLEVGGAALVVRQPSVVQYLQQDVEHVGVGLLYLVEQQHRVGLAAYGLRQLATLVVAHVARRCTNQSADGVLLLILRHVDTCHHLLVVEQVFCQRLRQLGLADTRGAEEDERGYRALRVLQSGTRAAYGIRDGCDGFVLSDDALVQFLFQVEQLLALALQHAGDGNARPAAHHLGNIVGGDCYSA